MEERNLDMNNKLITSEQQFDGIDEESVVLYTPQSQDLPQVYQKIEEQLAKRVGGIPDASRASVKDRLFETMLFQYIKEVPTPLEVIKYRIGSDNKEFEYFDEHYTNSELDRLFPGWWTEDMATRYDAQAMAYITTGYLMIEYTLPSGITRIRKIYAVGGARVYAKKDTKDTAPEPSQPEDRAIASLTRWKKLAGKQLGIGLDIYHQKITQFLISAFEDRIRDWVYPYAEPYKDLVKKSITTGKGMRKLLKMMPTPQQTARFLQGIHQVREFASFPKETFWEKFTRMDQSSVDTWLNTFETALKSFLEKNLNNTEYK